MLIHRILGDFSNPWCQVCYDPVSLGTLAAGTLLSAGAGYGVQKLTQSKAPPPVVPTLQPELAAPDPFAKAKATQDQLAVLGASGRDSTNLTKKRATGKSSPLDEGGDTSGTPAYTNTALGG